MRLYRFRDISTYLSQVVDFNPPPPVLAALWGDPGLVFILLTLTLGEIPFPALSVPSLLHSAPPRCRPSPGTLLLRVWESA